MKGLFQVEIKISELTGIIHGILNGLLSQKYMKTATQLKFKFLLLPYFIIILMIPGDLIFIEEMLKITNTVFGQELLKIKLLEI